MMIYERNNSASTNHCHIFNTGGALLGFDCHSIALNDQESRLLLVGSHGLALINLETIYSQGDNSIAEDPTVSMSSLPDVKNLPLFDTCNINRPVVEWNHYDPNQYAVAIDRLVRLYTVDQSRINEASTYIDSQHQRPISTISYSPHDSCWLLTGSLDGQIQVWDTRHYSPKNPAALKFTVATPFSIRRIQWLSTKSDHSNQLAVQCDRCIRIYDIRRTDSQLLSSTDLEHSQRITSMDGTRQHHSIATLSLDHSIRIFSMNGHMLAESVPNEQSPYAFSKIRATGYDNLFVCAARDTLSPTHGFVGWRCDEDQYLRPLTDHIVTTTSSPVVDFTLVRSPRFLNLFNNSQSLRSNDDTLNRFVLLTWCRDGHLSLVEMDSTFRQAWMNQQTRAKAINLSDSSSSTGLSRASSNSSRQPPVTRSSSTMMAMDAIKDETTDSGETEEDDDDNAFQGMSTSPQNTLESSDASDDNDDSTNSIEGNDPAQEISIASEFESVDKNYGDDIIVEIKDEQRRMCVLRCTSALNKSFSFRICLILSRHYPIISQLFVRFKSSAAHNDEHFKSFQARIQLMLEETSSQCFYRGQLCLRKCLTNLRNLFDTHYKQEKLLSNAATTANSTNKKRDPSLTGSEIDSLSGLSNGNSNHAGANNNTASSRLFGVSSSSTRTSDSQLSGLSHAQESWRTCGARFSGGTHLICFGRTAKNQQSNAVAIQSALSDGTMSRPQSLPMRSTSYTAGKSRENSMSIEQSTHRTAMTTTNNMPIQSMPNSQRLPMSSAPVRSIMASSIFKDHQRLSSYRRSLGHLICPSSTVAIYDVSILLPVSRKLADDYRIDLNNPIDMCEFNEQKTHEMGKDDLARCWRLLGGLLAIQPSLEQNDAWFQTPIAQGLIKHLVSTYATDGDIQSASMFLLTMSQGSYLKMKMQSKLVNEHNHDPVLYAYACLLHRWKYFYKRTQILSQIDHNCQSPAPFNQTAAAAAAVPPITSTNITCSICSQPVLGQQFLCAICGHGGHLMHMHEWFSSEELKHRCCPEKGCACRCIVKQQELLTTNPIQAQQQQTPSITSRPYYVRQPSGSIRPL